MIGDKLFQRPLKNKLFKNPQRGIVPRAHVIFCTFGEFGRGGRQYVSKGKINFPQSFFHVFADYLHSKDVATSLVDYYQLGKHIRFDNTIVVMLYNEIFDRQEVALESDVADPRVRFVWNSFSAGRAIVSKSACRDIYERIGCPGLPRVESDSQVGSIFASDEIGSGGDIRNLYSGGEKIPPGKFSSKFVDSATEFKGESYLVSLRVLSVGSQVVAPMVRARQKSEGCSVHLSNTPQDASLIGYLHEQYVTPNLNLFSDVSARVDAEIGPGFYAHDLVPSSSSGKVFICETGFKFDSGFSKKMGALKSDLPQYSDLFDRDSFAMKSAELFWEECERRCPDLKVS